MNDKDLILELGGPAKVAKLLGFGKYGQQRVTNWMTRGIPDAVKVDYPHIFMRDALKKIRRAESRKQRGADHA